MEEKRQATRLKMGGSAKEGRAKQGGDGKVGGTSKHWTEWWDEGGSRLEGRYVIGKL